MNKTDLKRIHDITDHMGDRTKNFILIEGTHDGKVHFAYGGHVQDVLLLSFFMDLQLKKAYEQSITLDPPK